MKLSREFKIGLVAVIAVCVAIWGINYLKGINIFTSSDQYYAVYSNVKGLVENAAVTINGYKVGNVHKIEFDKDNVNKIVVEISLEERLRLKRNTALLIRSGGIISETKNIEIVPGNGEGYYEPGDTLPALIQMELTDYIDPIRKKIESLVSAVDTVMVALGDIMDKETRKNLQGTIANINSATSSLKLSLQPTGSLSQSLSNLSQITNNLKKSNEDISKMLRNFADVSDTLKQAELKALITNASATFAKTADLFGKINNGEGTAGQLVVNDSIYNNLNSAIGNFDSLLIDLRLHPKRYVHVSVFGKKGD
jgi:phospholipid/cholesterol/gamma-HCH transport system substrate-binding protein